MVNVAESGVINFQGQGFVRRPQGGYKSGEFARLLNCELTSEGAISKRVGFYCPFTDKMGDSVGDFFGIRRAIGTWDDAAIFGPNYNDFQCRLVADGIDSDSNDNYLEGPDGELVNIYKADGTLQVNAATYNDTHSDSVWHPYVIEGFQRYNQINYFLISGVLATEDNTPAYTYRKAVVAIAKRNDITATVNPDANARNAPGTGTGGRASSSSFDIKIIDEIDVKDQDTTATSSKLPYNGIGNANNIITHFVHKDRIWIVTPTKILFSKPTDPWEWRVSQDGGFVSMADAQINWALPVGDSIYIFSDSKIDILTYSVSPNVDGQTSRISNTIGADSAAEHNNQVYFVKYDSLYQISGINIEKIADLNWNLEKVDATPKYYQVWSYYDYLIVAHRVRDVDLPNSYPAVQGANQNDLYFKGYGTYYRPYTDTNASPDGLGKKIPTSFFMINLENQTISELAYSPDRTRSDINFISDIQIVTNEDKNNQQSLYAIAMNTVKRNHGLSSFNEFVFVRMYPPSYQLDSPVSQDDTWATFPISTGLLPSADATSFYSEFVLRDIAPDGAEYAIKKFRNLEIEGAVVGLPINLEFKFDDGAVTAPVDIGPSATIAPPIGYRVGLNQRARAFSVRATTAASIATLGFWKIFDLRTLWTYTSRHPSKRNG
jgi:hypothetical protein